MLFPGNTQFGPEYSYLIIVLYAEPGTKAKLNHKEFSTEVPNMLVCNEKAYVSVITGRLVVAVFGFEK